MATGGKDPGEQVDELRAAVNEVDDKVSKVQKQLDSLQPALASLAGLDNVAVGVAELVQILEPIRDLAGPPAQLDQPALDAIQRIDTASPRPPGLLVDAVTVADQPITYIGQRI